MDISQKIQMVKNTIEFRMKKMDSDATKAGRKLVGKTRDIIRTKLELKVCSELELDYSVFSDQLNNF